MRVRPAARDDGLPVGLQLQLLEAEHLPATLNRSWLRETSIRAGIEFDKMGRRVVYHPYRPHPNDGATGTDVRRQA